VQGSALYGKQATDVGDRDDKDLHIVHAMVQPSLLELARPIRSLARRTNARDVEEELEDEAGGVDKLLAEFTCLTLG